MKRLQVLKFAGQEVTHDSLDEKMLAKMKNEDNPKVYAVANEGSYSLLLWDSTQQRIRLINHALPIDFFSYYLHNPFAQGVDKAELNGLKLWETQKETNTPTAQALLIMLLKHGFRGYQMTEDVYEQLKMKDVSPIKLSSPTVIEMSTLKDLSGGFVPRKDHKASAVLTDICREVGLIEGLGFSKLPSILGSRFSHVIKSVEKDKSRSEEMHMSLNTESGEVDVEYLIKVTSIQRQVVTTRKYHASINPTSFKDVGRMVTDIYKLQDANRICAWGIPSVINNSYSTCTIAVNDKDVEVPAHYKTSLEHKATNILKKVKSHPATLGTLHDKATSWRLRDESALSDSWAGAILYTYLLVNSISLIDNITTYLGGFPEEQSRVLERITTEMFREKVASLDTTHYDRGQEEGVLQQLVTLENTDIQKANLAILRPFKYLGVAPLGRSLEGIQEGKVVVQPIRNLTSYSRSTVRRNRHTYNNVVDILTQSPDYAELIMWFEALTKLIPEVLRPIKKIGKAVPRYVGGKNVLKELVNPNSVVAHLTGFKDVSQLLSMDDYVINFLFEDGYLKKVFSESMLQWWESEEVKPIFLGDDALNLFFRNSSTRNLLRLLWNAPFTDGQRKRVLLYLVQDATSRQRVRNPKSDYGDYLHAYSQLVELGFRSWDRFDLEPYSVRLAHDIYTAEYEELKEGMEKEVFLANYQGLKDMELSEHIILDDYFLQLPESEDDLKKEGKALSHCVGGYGSRIKRGECVIVFLRSVEDPETSFVTVELNKHQVHGELVYTLGHIEGDRDNRNPSLRIRNALKVVTDLVRKSQEQFNKTGEYISLAPEKKKKKKEKQEALAI